MHYDVEKYEEVILNVADHLGTVAAIENFKGFIPEVQYLIVERFINKLVDNKKSV